MIDKTISGAIIGCGRIGKVHAAQMGAIGKVLAVCDIDPAAAGELGKQYGASVYSSYEEMFEKEKDINLVSVCTPNGLHAIHTVAALRKGAHVICEKPMALTVTDCTEMIHEATKAGRHLFVVKQNRYNPPVQALKLAVDEGRLGKIYSLQVNCFWNRTSDYYKNTWRGTKSLDGGTLFTQFSHFIDLIYWIIGDIDSVEAFTGNFGHQGEIEFEDTGVIILRFKTGVIGTVNYTTNSFQKNMEGSLTVFGEKGTVKVGGQYLNHLEYELIDKYKIGDLPAGNLANSYGTYDGSMSNHNMVFENVRNVLYNSATATTTAVEAMKTVEIIRRIYEAAISSQSQLSN